MKFYDLLVKHLKIGGLINSVFKLSNENNKAGIEFEIDSPSHPFIGYDKTNKELVGSNDGINYFPLYAGDGAPLVVEKTSINEKLIVSLSDGFPVGIISPNNVVIPLQKETVNISEDNYIIDLSAYISYAGLDSDEGNWKVYVASGSRGSKGDPGESLKLEIGTVTSGASPNVELVGESPNQILNFVLPTFWNSFVTVTESDNNTISVPTNSIPVMLKTNTGKYYNIKGSEISLNDNKTNFVINISNALAVNNISSFNGNWEVYYAGGAKPVSNIIFSPSTNGVGQLNSSNDEIVLQTYLIESNCINLYNKSSESGTFVIKVFVDDIEKQSFVLNTSNKITKNTLNFNELITGNVKIVRDFGSSSDTVENVNIYKIEG